MLFLTSCTFTKPISKSGFYFDTMVTIKLYNSNDEQLLDHCMELCSNYEQLFSRTIPTSDISKINQSGGRSVTVSDETISLIQKGLDYGKLSDGAFDITIGSVSSLWDFSSVSHNIPDSDTISHAVSHVNYKSVIISGNQVTLSDPEAQIDLGGIAKGYIADQLKMYLTNEGVKHAIINLGGNVLTIGSRSGNNPFHIGIQKPFKNRNTMIATVSAIDKSIVTSGPYERYFRDSNGKLYHHILNSHTGYPIQNDLNGVTILSDHSVDGDALSTICYVLGKEKGTELIDSFDGVEAIFIDEDYNLTYTDSSLADFVTPAP